MEYSNYDNEEREINVEVKFYRDLAIDYPDDADRPSRITHAAVFVDNEWFFTFFTGDYNRDKFAGEIANAYVWRQDKELIKKELINILPETLEII